MSTNVAEFTVAVDGGDKQQVVVNKLDFIVADRELRSWGKPVAALAQEGYIEPILRLAYTAATRCRVLPDGMGFDAFVERCDVEFITDDDTDADGSGNG